MSLLRYTTWLHGNTGERQPDTGEMPNGHAVHARSYVRAPAWLPGLKGLPDEARLVIDSALDLGPFRLERGLRARGQGYAYAYTLRELKAAFEHPCVTRERIVVGIVPPERGRRLALFDAIARWIGHVESEWRGLGPDEAMVGPAKECLEPVLVELHREWRVPLTRQCNEWLRGVGQRIPGSVALEAERCLRAAIGTRAGALARSLEDQLAAIGARSDASRCVDGPDALRCARVLVEPFYSEDHRVLWRPVVDLSSPPGGCGSSCARMIPRASPRASRLTGLGWSSSSHRSARRSRTMRPANGSGRWGLWWPPGYGRRSRGRARFGRMDETFRANQERGTTAAGSQTRPLRATTNRAPKRVRSILRRSGGRGRRPAPDRRRGLRAFVAHRVRDPHDGHRGKARELLSHVRV